MKTTMKTMMKTVCIAAFVLMTGCESEEARQMRQFTEIMNGLIELAAWDAVLNSGGYADSSYSSTSSGSTYSSGSSYSSGSDVISSNRYVIYPAANDMGINFNATSW